MQTETGFYKLKLSTDLHHIDDLSEAIKNLKPFESMSISDRALVYRGKIFSIESGRTFNALADDYYQNSGFDPILLSETIHNSDKVLTSVNNQKTMRLVFKNDPGRRNCSLVGSKGLRAMNSAIMISNDHMLIQLKE